jgi:hypothetical protein
MAGYSSSILQLAAATAVAATLWTAPTAVAAETGAAVSKAAAATRIAPSRAARIAASYYGRHFRPIRSHPDCSGVWCGRQFVLMVGIAY